MCGSPPDDATPIFISESGSSILGLSNDISFFSKLFLEGGKNEILKILKITKKTKVGKDSATIFCVSTVVPVLAKYGINFLYRIYCNISGEFSQKLVP